MDLKERIQNLCKNKCISMNQLETELGFGRGYISKLGKSTPNTTKIQLIADYFNITVDYLMTGKNDINNSVLLSKNHREIGKDLDRVLKEIENDPEGPLFYNGMPIDDESLLWLRDVLKMGLNRLQAKKDSSDKK